MVDSLKVETVKKLQEKFSRAKFAIFADYRGLNVSEINDLRNRLRAEQIEFRVIKNTLARQAVEETPFSEAVPFFEGPTSVALSYEEALEPVKTIVDYTKDKKVFEIKGGILEGRTLDAREIKRLADLPPREVLQSQILSAFQSPQVQFVGLLQGVLQSLLGTLRSYAETKSS